MTRMKLCSVSFTFSVIAIQFLLLSTIVNGQQATDSCNLTLPLKDLALDSSLLQCVEVWGDQNYILRYSKTMENTWSFVLSAPDSSAYIGIGFSTDGEMVGSSAVVGWITPDGGSGAAKQYLLGGESPSKVMPDQGDLKIVNGSLKIESVSSRLFMSFQLTAEMPRERLLYAKGPSGFFPSSPEFRLREHEFKTTTTIAYNTGPATVGPAMSPGPASGPTPSSAYSLSPHLLFFGISLIAMKFF
ncbi:unnamed protein product [Eruca vesicaria subsp. sativa]|uniref:DOMON domain-containing protein n=1 Tax=Eruca vesicaria subsp. sativa TaxID=29727 RepID=A0ABC8KJV7_ERUVS|nr:unnamed protein product [Eruca vesicaria subsp. sativa]